MFNNLKKVKNDKLKISALNLKTRVSHKFVSFRNVCKRNLHAVGQWLRTAVVPQIPRVAAVAIMLICMTICAYADEKAGAGQIQSVGQTFKTNYMPAVKTLMNGIAACIAVVGAFSVYFKMQNGDQDVKNILVLQNWLERIRKEVTNKVLSIKRISDFLIFPILAQPTLKKI